MQKFPDKPLDDESYRALMAKVARSGRINHVELDSINAYVAKLKAGKGN